MDQYRPLLFTYAYNILGISEEAEDIVQDVFLKYMTAAPKAVDDPKAYLVRMTINHAINRKKSMAQSQKEYPGQWLPEPVSTETSETRLESREVLSYSMLVLMEKLEARQRGVFILREVFDYSHEEIAQTLSISVVSSRQLLSRAKRKISERDSSIPNEINSDKFSKYLVAIQNADMSALESLLQEDIELISDGGGKVSAGRKVVFGKENVMAMLLGIYRKFYQDIHMRRVEINHQPAVVYFTDRGEIINCQVLEYKAHKISAFYFIRNPEKLKFLQKNLSRLSHSSGHDCP